jgi:hypothetical protein
MAGVDITSALCILIPVTYAYCPPQTGVLFQILSLCNSGCHGSYAAMHPELNLHGNFQTSARIFHYSKGY